MKITFEEIPSAVQQLLDRMSALETAICQTFNQDSQDEFLNIRQTAAYLNLSVATVYILVQRLEIPVYKKGKKLYFSKPELSKWISSGRKKTAREIESEVEASLMLAKRKGL